jgi:lipopolysaccharide biosynthesis glycosyltransferase
MMYITLHSILRNANSGTCYDFHLLVPSDFSEKYRHAIGDLCKRYPCRVTFVDMGERMKNVKREKYGVPTFYRLLAAEVLPDRQKCICLDVDIIVRHDLGKLYGIDLGDCYVGGARDVAFEILDKNYALAIAPKKSDGWINAGVLLMNLDAIRRDGMTEKWVAMSEHGMDGKRPFRLADQDVINISCSGKIKFIGPKFNMLASTFPICTASADNRRCYEEAFGSKPLSIAMEDPYIIHFAGKKPWKQTYDDPFVNEWWFFCRKSPFYEKFSHLCVARNSALRYSTLNYCRYRILTYFSSGDKKTRHGEKALEVAYGMKMEKAK